MHLGKFHDEGSIDGFKLVYMYPNYVMMQRVSIKRECKS